MGDSCSYFSINLNHLSNNLKIRKKLPYGQGCAITLQSDNNIIIKLKVHENLKMEKRVQYSTQFVRSLILNVNIQRSSFPIRQLLRAQIPETSMRLCITY